MKKRLRVERPEVYNKEELGALRKHLELKLGDID